MRDKVDHHSQFYNRGSGYLVSRQFNLSVLNSSCFLYSETKLRSFPVTRELSGAVDDFNLILMAMCLDFTWSDGGLKANTPEVWTWDFKRAPDWNSHSRDLCAVRHRARYINATRFFVQGMMNNACHQRPLFAFMRKSFFSFKETAKERKYENKYPALSWSTWRVTLITLRKNAGVDLSSVRVLSKTKAHVRYIYNVTD